MVVLLVIVRRRRLLGAMSDGSHVRNTVRFTTAVQFDVQTANCSAVVCVRQQYYVSKASESWLNLHDYSHFHSRQLVGEGEREM